MYCETCGKLETQLGPLFWDRGYWWCPDCASYITGSNGVPYVDFPSEGKMIPDTIMFPIQDWALAYDREAVVVSETELADLYPPRPTKDEFEQAYADRSGVTVEQLHQWGRFAVPCECDEPECEGWAMVHERDFALLFPHDLQQMRDMVDYYGNEGTKRERKLARVLAKALAWIELQMTERSR